MTPLQFHQRFVSRNKPLVLTDAIADWPALRRWSNEYLLSRVGDEQARSALATIL